MKDRQASATALFIAAALVLMADDPACAGLVSAASAELSKRVLETYSPVSRGLLKLLGRSWIYRIAALGERLTIPGILRHYGLRKKCIARLAGEALRGGISQVIILGAGFDALAMELHREFAKARFWEIDHPATQRCKKSVLNLGEVQGIRFIATNLASAGLPKESLRSADFDPGQRTLWIAEGLLMYFSEGAVLQLLEQIREMSSPASRMIFTFTERDGEGRIRFQKQTRLVDWWLRQRGEPFRWGIERARLAEFIFPWRVLHIYDEQDLLRLDSAEEKKTPAAGELICLAEV